MIKTDAQLDRTKAQAEGLKSVVTGLKSGAAGALPPEALKAIVDSHDGLIGKLEAEITEYESLKRGVIRLPSLATPRDLVAHLTKFRIALGITQEQLASMVGVSRQTLNKYEEQEYQLADVDFVSRVIEALGVLPEVTVRHKTLEVYQPAASARRPPTEKVACT